VLPVSNGSNQIKQNSIQFKQTSYGTIFKKGSGKSGKGNERIQKGEIKIGARWQGKKPETGYCYRIERSP